MSEEAEKVVVILDASRDVSWSAIQQVLQGLSLKPGDELMLLGVFHQVNNPVRYSKKVDPNSTVGTSQKFGEEEVTKKKEEYREIMAMLQLPEEVKVHIEVEAGPSSKVVAVRSATRFRATWVILDRQMKKDKKYFMESLSCGISRMKHDNTIKQLRGPKPIEKKKSLGYDEMLPGSTEEEVSPKTSPTSQHSTIDRDEIGGPPSKNHHKWPLSKSSSTDHMLVTPSTVSSSNFSWAVPKRSISALLEQESNAEQKNSGKGSPVLSNDDEQEQQVGFHILDEALTENSICSDCKNRRPEVGWKTRFFTYTELHAATRGFFGDNYLSEGGFGSVYRGELKNGLNIAVKQYKNASFQGEEEFQSEVSLLSKIRHENLVMLLGSCSEGNHRLLVYEYVCNGSLDQHLSKKCAEQKRQHLSWDKRIKIALGAAKGLEFLHGNNIIHRDVTPGNILITHDHVTLLGDFGLATSQHEEDSNDSSKNKVVGALGYMAPEYAENGKASSKTDVYSFGVVLLQLITGLAITDNIKGGKSLIGWARPLLEEKNYPDLIDERIADSHDMHQLFWMVRVAENCLRKDPRKRWTMEKVVTHLNSIIESKITCAQGFSPAQ
ncbi:probable serine/threonine-protein kinase PBL2 isoform X2 [Diospyros lotus]|uniref:probable serine/threonine-protein kinase PBL2 isoform X2 n=1 Tax=Diospyros lotus TaxID=55363 RepID=UPI0022544626|nr:probable serine/threonine-protein kinase PBL2 isoform X2 [Diospyros lotus]